MADVVYDFIRGDDFEIPMTLTNPDDGGAVVPITGWIITSQVRYARKLIDDLTVTLTNAAAGEFSISLPKEDTALWPAGPKNNPRRLKCDIQFDRPGEGRVSSQTFYIDCMEDQTYG